MAMVVEKNRLGSKNIHVSYSRRKTQFVYFRTVRPGCLKEKEINETFIYSEAFLLFMSPPTNRELFDRATLVDKFDISAKRVASKEQADVMARQVDAHLATLFGAKYFAGGDWNIFRKPAFTLKEMGKILADKGIDIPPEVLVRATLHPNHKRFNTQYTFVAYTPPEGEEEYQLDFQRSGEGDEYIS